MAVVPGVFVHLQLERLTEQSSRAGEFDYMVGESCWPAFTQRIALQYNWSATSKEQQEIERFVVDHAGRSPVPLNFSIGIKANALTGARDSPPRVPVCASKGSCVGDCSPEVAVLRAGQPTFEVVPGHYGGRQRSLRLAEEDQEAAASVTMVPMFVKTQGVIRPSMWGVTPLVKQADVKSMKKREKVRGTVKLARLCGDNMTKDLLIGSCFDQKPFYILTNAAEKVTWDTMTRMVYSKKQEKHVPFQFLRWSLSNTYNHQMNDNDVADQYRLGYRMMRFQRRTKWWWSLFMFFWETSMNNAYQLMKSYYRHMGFQMTIDHWDFQEDVGWALMDPDKYWTTKRRKIGESVVNVTEAPPPVPEGPRRKRFSAKALEPEGSLKRRLDTSLRHFPERIVSRNFPCCQMHRLANSFVNKTHNKPTGGRSDVFECGDCGVALCINCWKIYHTTMCFYAEDYAKVLRS